MEKETSKQVKETCFWVLILCIMLGCLIYIGKNVEINNTYNEVSELNINQCTIIYNIENNSEEGITYYCDKERCCKLVIQYGICLEAFCFNRDQQKVIGADQ